MFDHAVKVESAASVVFWLFYVLFRLLSVLANFVSNLPPIFCRPRDPVPSSVHLTISLLFSSFIRKRH